MSETNSRPRIGRSIAAVIAGVLAGIVLTIGTDVALSKLGVFPPLGEQMADSLLFLAAIYRCIYGVAGSYVAARLAPNQPMMHALVLGMLGLVANGLGAVTMWDKGPAVGAHWYPIVLVITAIPCAWVGGKLRERQLPMASAPV
jgi:drug/metabolite transporter (DMT)-like permease